MQQYIAEVRTPWRDYKEAKQISPRQSSPNT